MSRRLCVLLLGAATVLIVLGCDSAKPSHRPRSTSVREEVSSGLAGTTNFSILIDSLTISAEIDAHGDYLNGLNDEDDPFWFRATVPRRITLELHDDVRTRSVLELHPAGETTEVRFQGRFLDGLGVLYRLGVKTLRIDAEAPHLRITGTRSTAFELPWTIYLADGSLVLNGVTLCPLPEVGVWNDTGESDSGTAQATRPADGEADAAQGSGADPICSRVTVAHYASGRYLTGDMIRPAHGAAPLGAVLCLFGSAFSTVDREWSQGWPNTLGREGYIVLAPHYSCLSDGTHYAETLEDVYRSYQWLQAASRQYGFDSDDVSILGYSAGAMLALLVAYAPPDGLGLSAELTPSVAPQSVIVLAGAPLLLPPDEPFDRDQARNWTLAEWVGDWNPALFEQLAPGTWLRSGVPDTLIIHHRLDGVMPFAAAERFAEACAAHGIRHRLVCLDDDQPPIRAHYVLRSPENERAIATVLDWLSSAR